MFDDIMRTMDPQSFERVVAEAIDSLPQSIRRHIANVAIVVDDLPDAQTMELAGIDDPMQLLGFYHGVPLTVRTQNYSLVPPDKISLFRKSILALCDDEAKVRETIRHTVLHELAHYFGIDDDRLEELGAY